jgi:toxin ParE1/3/4
MSIQYTLAAFCDRKRIVERLHRRSKTGARNVMASFKAAVELLREQPDRGNKTNIAGVLVLINYPYLMFYRIRQDAIELLHIRHTSRRPRK